MFLTPFVNEKHSSHIDTCRDIYLNKVLTSWEYFVYTKVKIGKKQDSILIINGQLRHHLIKNERRKKFADSSYYEGSLKEIMTANKPLELSKKLKKNSEWFPVRRNAKVDSLSKIGRQVFIDHYFDKFGNLKLKEISDDEITWVIKTLIDWNILVSGPSGFDGGIHIDRKQKLCSD